MPTNTSSPPAVNWQKTQDTAFRVVARCFAIAVLAILGAIIVSLAFGAAPAFREFGFGFVTSSAWNPVTEQYGALLPIFGTIVTSVIALAIAIPLSFGIALFLPGTPSPSNLARCCPYSERLLPQ